MNRKSIVVVGSSNTDLIIKLDRIPRPGETIIGGQFASAAGGKGANQAVAAARAGGEVSFVARVGFDDLGEKALAGFIKDRINVKHVIRDRANPSGVALIFVGKDGENSIAVASGANDKLSPADVRNDTVENPCRGTASQNKITFESQSTYFLPVPGKPGQFIYMGDRWRPQNTIDGRYIWLPVQFDNGMPVLKWKAKWNLNVFK